MAGTLTVGQLAPDVGTNLYINAQQYGGNVIVGNTTTTLLNISPSGNTTVNGVITSNTITSNTGASLVLQSNNTTAITVDTSQNVTFAGSINSPNTFGFKNRIINGGMLIDQRNSGASVTQNTSGIYTVDRWQAYGTVTSKFTVQQSSTAPTGFSKSVLITSSAATTVASTDLYNYSQSIEGFNFADFGFGTANAKTVTVSFWVYSSVAGSFGACLQNYANNRSYPFNYTVLANTWTYVTQSIIGDTGGTWTGATNGGAANIVFSMGAGSNFTGSSSAWASANYVQTTGATNFVTTSGATLYITGVQLEVGSKATSFDWRPYGTELQLCQRYYETGGFVSFTTGGVNGIYQPIQFKVTKRVAAASCTATNGRSLTMNIFNDGTGVATGMYQGSNDSGASVSTWTVSAEL